MYSIDNLYIYFSDKYAREIDAFVCDDIVVASIFLGKDYNFVVDLEKKRYNDGFLYELILYVYFFWYFKENKI